MTQFNYKDYDTVNLNNTRFYDIDGCHYPSITSVLGNTMSEEKKKSLQNWRNSLGAEKAAKFTKDAAERGTQIHLMCERFLKGENVVQKPNEFTPQVLGMFNGLKLKLGKIKDIWGQEVVLYSHELEVAGRCDLIGVYNDSPAIIDFKTSTRLKDKSKIGDYVLQITAYAQMHNEMFDTKIEKGVILMITEQGFPSEFHYTLTEHKLELEKRVADFYTRLLDA
jgi:ATP-dependent exoDNAse (exonuclease V) beta subunit